METSRRSFLKGAVGTAAVAAAATLSIPTEAAKAPKKWDVTTDVVVIGFGGAGAAGQQRILHSAGDGAV